MLSLDLILEDPEKFARLLRLRKITDLKSEEIVENITGFRRTTTQLQKIKQKKNSNTEKIKECLKKKIDAKDIIVEQKKINEEIHILQEKYTQEKLKLDNQLLQLPNWLDEDLPIGSEEKNLVLRTWGKIPEFSFSPKTHYEIGELGDYLQPARAAKISGARFAVYQGKMAKLERVLMNFMIDLHTHEFGYTEVNIPQLVTEDSMLTSGQFPRFQGEFYSLPKADGLHLIPTSEVPLVNLYRDEIVPESKLPLALVAFSSCFRREAGAAGKDTRGLVRLHQFQKVELVQLCIPQDSKKIHFYMIEHAEEVLKRLQIPFRTVLKATDDTGISAVKSYDLEVWMPGLKRWLEISSISNCHDFQSRRGHIRYRPQNSTNNKPQFVHTLNGSGLALGRTLIAIMENYQNQAGDFTVPPVLEKYFLQEK